MDCAFGVSKKIFVCAALSVTSSLTVTAVVALVSIRAMNSGCCTRTCVAKLVYPFLFFLILFPQKQEKKELSTVSCTNAFRAIFCGDSRLLLALCMARMVAASGARRRQLSMWTRVMGNRNCATHTKKELRLNNQCVAGCSAYSNPVYRTPCFCFFFLASRCFPFTCRQVMKSKVALGLPPGLKMTNQSS